MGAQPRHDSYAMSIAYKNNKNSFFKSSFDMKYITKLHFISFTYLAKQYLNLEYTWIMETTLQVVLILSVSHFFKNKSVKQLEYKSRSFKPIKFRKKKKNKKHCV